jgi:hypothetical protein
MSGGERLVGARRAAKGKQHEGMSPSWIRTWRGSPIVIDNNRRAKITTSLPLVSYRLCGS